MAFDTVELIKVIREVLDPRVRELTNKSAIFWNMIEAGETKQTNPRGVRVVTEAFPNASMLWFSEGGKYPAGGNRQFVSLTITYRRFVIGTRLTRDTLENKADAIIDVLKDSMKGDTKQALVEFNQQSYKDGKGVKGVANGARDSATTITLAEPFGARQIYVNGKYQFYCGPVAHGAYVPGDAISTALTVSARNKATGLITADAISADVIAGDVLTYDGSYDKAIHGLDYIINNTTTDYFGLDPSVYTQFRAVVDAAGGSLSVAKMNRVLFQIKYLKGADKVNMDSLMIVSAPAQANRYVNLADPTQAGSTTAVRLQRSKAIDLGYNTFMFSGIEWVEDTDCSDDVLFFLDRSSINKYEFKPLGVVPLVGTDSGIAPVPGFDSSGVGSYYDSGVYFMSFKGELASVDPGKNIKMTDLDRSGLSHGRF